MGQWVVLLGLLVATDRTTSVAASQVSKELAKIHTTLDQLNHTMQVLVVAMTASMASRGELSEEQAERLTNLIGGF